MEMGEDDKIEEEVWHQEGPLFSQLICSVYFLNKRKLIFHFQSAEEDEISEPKEESIEESEFTMLERNYQTVRNSK